MAHDVFIMQIVKPIFTTKKWPLILSSLDFYYGLYNFSISFYSEWFIQ